MILFGGWGKIGINCFVLITGYFMCKSKITLSKFVKLYLQIIFYAFIIDFIFMLSREMPVDIKSLYKFFHHIVPVTGINQNFTSCFIVFWLLIPFLNTLIQHIDKRAHRILILLCVVFFSIMPLDPTYKVSINYVEWFCILYFIASYIRLHEEDFASITHNQWGALSIISILIAIATMLALTWIWMNGNTSRFVPYILVSDSNQIIAVLVALATFMWFKDAKIKQSRFINTVGASTFGVLLIHAHSDTMRQWLWKETFEMTDYYNELPALQMILYASFVVLLIFCTCSVIEILRTKIIEPRLNTRIEEILKAGGRKLKSSLVID